MSPLDENIAKNMRGRVEEMARNPKWNTFQEELGVDESRVPVIDLNDRYWSNTDADVTGVIVAPEDVLKIKEAVGPEGEEIIKQLKSNGAIYVDKVDYNPDKETIKDIHNDPAGENVRFNGLGAFKAVSMQESLSAGGVPIPADVNLQAGWMWDSENPEENILVLGASAKGTLASSKAVSGGKYEITGKTVSAQTIDSSLSKSRKIIVINDLERKTEINDILSDYPEIKGKEEILESIIKGEDIETLERRQKSSSEALNSDLSEEKEGKRDLKDEETYQKPKDKKDGELAQNKDVKEEPSSTKLSNNSSKKSDKKENSINEVFNTISRLLGF